MCEMNNLSMDIENLCEHDTEERGVQNIDTLSIGEVYQHSNTSIIFIPKKASAFH